MKKALSLLLCLVMLAVVLPAPQAQAATYDETPLRIGLAYNLNAVPAAKFINVQNSGTYGYSFGYYDSNRQFYTLFSTEERRVAVLKDKPLWVQASSADDAEYYDVQPSSYTYSIGCYHLEADVAYGSYTDVMNAVAWVNSLGLKAFPAYVGSAYKVRIGEHLTTEKAQAAAGEVAAATGYSLKVVGGSQTCYTVTVLGSDKILFELDMGGTSLGMIPTAGQTWFLKRQYMGGFDFNRANGNDITVVNVIGMNDYLKGVIPYEMSPTWPLEALKVQAVAAKCYAVNCLNQHKHRSLGFDLCNTTDCQVYYGMGSASAVSNQAVDETYGIYATHEGEIIQAYYHSSSGGYTEDVENIWNNYVPYLRAVEDKYLVHTNPYSFSITLSDVTRILQAKKETSKQITDLYVSRYSEVGNVLELTAVEAGGNTLRFPRDKARTILNSDLTPTSVRVQSHRYTVSGNAAFYVNGSRLNKSVQSTYAIGGDGKASQISVSNDNLRVITKNGVETVNLQSTGGTYNISGTGSGHNIGMSQWGAHAMAEQGFGYEEIIKFYYTNVTVGRID